MSNALGALFTTLATLAASWAVSAGLDRALDLPGIDPVQCAVAGGVCGLIGYIAGFDRGSRSARDGKPAPKAPSARAAARAREREKRDYLRRAFAAMPKSQRELVSKALDHGSVSRKIDDPSALALCDLGILHAPGVTSGCLWADFSVRPSVVSEVSRHRKKWLDEPVR